MNIIKEYKHLIIITTFLMLFYLYERSTSNNSKIYEYLIPIFLMFSIILYHNFKNRNSKLCIEVLVPWLQNLSEDDAQKIINNNRKKFVIKKNTKNFHNESLHES